MPKHQAVRALKSLLDDSDYEVRMRALETLEQYRPLGTGICRLLIQKLRDPDLLVRITACEVLEELGVTAPLAYFRALLEDEEPLVRGAAALYFAKVNPRACRRMLAPRFHFEKDAQTKVRMAAALYILRRRSSLNTLLRFLADRDYRVRCAAVNLLADYIMARHREIVCAALRHLEAIEKTVAVQSSIKEVLPSLCACQRAGR